MHSDENICLQTVSVPRSKQFSKSKAQGKPWALGSTQCQRHISLHVFKVKIWSYCVYYPLSNISCNTLDLLKMRNITHILPSLTWGIFSHAIRLDQPRERKHICRWTIDPIHKWLPIKNSFVSIKISPTNLVLELIIQKNFYFQTRLVGLI